jgi:hypothetical protein
VPRVEARLIQPLLTAEERSCAEKKFARSMKFLEHVEMYWVPSIRGIVARTVGATREFKLPVGSVSIGIYMNPFPTAEFIGDLEDTLAKIEARGKSNEAAAAAA